MDFAALVRNAQEGDTDAYAALVERFQGMAFGYAYTLLGDFHLAQDATQDALLDGLRHIRQIRHPFAFPMWLRRVVHMHCYRLRRRKQFATVPLAEGIAVPDGNPLADERLEHEEMKKRVTLALDSLPEEERAVTLLFYIHDYRQKDIGEFLEIPVNTVKNRLRSARRKLAERVLDMAQEVLREETPSFYAQFLEVKELEQACKQGDIARVTNLLQKHSDVLNSPDYDTRFPYPESCLWSPLGKAAFGGHEALVKVLLDMDANPVPYEVCGQYHEDTGKGWLDELRERGHHPIADRIQHAIQERYGPFGDEAAIHQAVRDGNTERVQALIREKPERVRQVDDLGNTALHWAIWNNDAAMTRLLVEHGSPVDALNGNGRTLSVVALFGFHRWWRYLEQPEVLDLLRAHGAKDTILIAATVGDVERVRNFLKADPSLANYLDPSYRRPLSAAAGKGYTEIVKLLLEHGADPNAKEAICEGGLALRDAAGKGYADVCRLLLEYGANPMHWVDSSGDALIGAAHGGHQDIMNLLYSYGATTEIGYYADCGRIDVVAEVLKLDPSKAKDVLPQGGWGRFFDGEVGEQLAMDIVRLAIRYGARYENESSWKLRNHVLQFPRLFLLLHEHGANPNVPLIRLAGDRLRMSETDFQARLKAIATLVEECGGDVNCRNEEGFTCLARAAEAGYKEIVEYLLSKGAEVRPSNTPDWAMPLRLAEKNGHTEIADILRQHGAAASS